VILACRYHYGEPMRWSCKTRSRTRDRAVHRMLSGVVISAMQAISRALEHEREVGLSVRGELRFVVME